MTKTSLTVVLCALGGAAISSVAHADSEWASRSELGYALARGNSDTDNGNLKFDIAHLWDKWIFAVGMDGLYGKTNGIGSAQRWDSHFQVDYLFTKKMFWFGKLEDQDDRYSGFAYQASAATGLGRIFLQSDSDKLTAQIGAGVRTLRLEELIRDPDTNAVLQRIPGESTEDAVASGAISYEHDFNASTKLLEAVSVESGRSNTLLKNNLALQVKMGSKLSLAVAYTYIRNSSPPPSILSKTDQLTTVNLVYEIRNEKIPAMPVAVLQHLNTAD
jgi:putative salt-induced outer membrane protein